MDRKPVQSSYFKQDTTYRENTSAVQHKHVLFIIAYQSDNIGLFRHFGVRMVLSEAAVPTNAPAAQTREFIA